MITEKNLLTAEEIVQMSKEYTFFSWSVQSDVNPIPIDRAEGVYFWDANGKRYLDFSSQIMNVNIGHQHPQVISAIKEQAETLCYAHPGMATLNELRNYLRENGLFTFIKANFVFIVPPLCITSAQIDEGLEIIDQALRITDAVVEA